MRCHTSLLLSLLITATAADSFTYSFDQRDVKPLKPQRKPLVAEPLRKREEPTDYASHNHLFPAIHPHLNKRDLRHLHSRQDHSLFYTKNGGIYLEDADMVATLDATFHWEAVILDHSAFVKNVTCLPEQMSIKLDSLKNFNSAKTNWTGDTIVFVSSDKSCHTTFPGQFGFFNTSSITYNQNTLTAVAKGKQIAVEQAIKEFNVVWGQWEAAGKPKTAQQAAAVLAASSSSTSSTRSSSSSTSSRPSSTSTSRSPAVAAATTPSTSSSRTVSTTRSTTTSSTRSATTSSRTTTTSSRTTTTSSRTTTTSSRTTTTSSRTTTTSSRTTTTSSRSTTSSSRPSTTTTRTSTSSATRSAVTSSSTSSSRTTSTTSRSASSSSTSRASSTTTTSSSTQAGLLAAAVASSSSSSSTTREVFETLVAPTGTGKCGVVPSAVPSGISKYFKQVSCDNSFDKSVDDFFTYLKDVANLNYYLSLWAPKTGITSADIPKSGMVLTRRGYVEKRDLFGFIKGVIKVVKAIVDIVISVVKAIVTAIRNLAESLLPTWSPSVSFTIPVALEPNSRLLDECPWGDGGFELWKWTAEESGGFDPLSFDTLAKMTGADQILTFKIDGVEQLPEPGVTVWCVDCGIHGSILTTGSATFTIIGPTRLSVRLRGDLNANVQLGVDGFYKFERPILEIPLTPDVGLPGFSIPGVITIGPYLTVDLVAKIEVEAVGQFLAGVNLDWPELGMFVDFMSPLSAKSYGFSPIVTPIFKASGEITATASLGIPIGINVGVSLLNGVWKEAIALVDTPAIQAVAEYSASYDNQEGGQLGGDKCAGIYFYSNVVNSLELEVPLVGAFELGKWEGPKFVEGCVNDNGVTTVRQQEQPSPAGATKAGCTLVDNVFKNGEFSNGASFWTPLVGHDNADLGVKAEGTNNELSVHRETFDTGGCFFRICPGTCLASGECAGGCDSACPQPQGPWKFTVSQTVDLCTYSQYNAELAGRIERSNDRTSCKVNKWFLKGVESNSAWLQREYPVNQPILPKTSQNPGNLVIGDVNKPIAITIPSRDNAASYKVSIGVEVECTSDDFDVRLDDFKLEPDASAFMKRDLQAMNRMMVHPDLATIHNNSTLQARQVPVIPVGNAAPTLPAANAAPTLEVTQAAPAIPAANAAPTLPPNLEAPAKTYVPGGNLVGGTYTLGAAVPTATAVFIGPNKYKFPAFSDIMASATVGVVGAAPTAGSGLPFTGWSTLTNFDPRQKSRLAAADDGNFYMVADNGAASPGTQFYSDDSIAFKDEAERMFHYFPATMNAYGVSRIRVASVLDTPLGAQMITLVPVTTPQGVAYVAADTDGHNFLLAWCTAPKWQGSKVFLVSDYEKGLTTLLSGDVQWIVTGNNVTECDPLVLTSQAGGLIPT